MDNLVAMEKSFNSSRQEKSWADWEGAPGMKPIDTETRNKMVELETQMRQTIKDRIAELAGMK